MSLVKVKVNMKRLRDRIRRPNRRLREIARKKAEVRFKKAKQQMVENFESHPVTQEIRSGPDAGNASSTLGGYGNLYSYIGFSSSAGDPTAIVSHALKNSTKLERMPSSVRRMKSTIEYKFKVGLVDMSILETMTPMPWENGRSWLRGIERGISGFGAYMYGKGGGRSGSAFQTQTQIRSGGFRNVKYMSEILKKFVKDLKRKRGAN